jgi:hypothetical protein
MKFSFESIKKKMIKIMQNKYNLLKKPFKIEHLLIKSEETIFLTEPRFYFVSN